MLEQPLQNKMMTGAPAKKEYHFAATSEHLAEVVHAETIKEAERIYHSVKRLIAPVEQSTPAPEPEASEEAVQ